LFRATAATNGDTRYVIDEQDARVIFPNPNVANGQRAGLVIVPW
jgi:succinylglutamate desuccinylase